MRFTTTRYNRYSKIKIKYEENPIANYHEVYDQTTYTRVFELLAIKCRNWLLEVKYKWFKFLNLIFFMIFK